MAGTCRSAWRQRHMFIVSIDGDTLTDVMSSEMCGGMGEDDYQQCLTLFSQPSRAKFVCPQYKSTKTTTPYCRRVPKGTSCCLSGASVCCVLTVTLEHSCTIQHIRSAMLLHCYYSMVAPPANHSLHIYEGRQLRIHVSCRTRSCMQHESDHERPRSSYPRGKGQTTRRSRYQQRPPCHLPATAP